MDAGVGGLEMPEKECGRPGAWTPECEVPGACTPEFGLLDAQHLLRERWLGG